MEFDQNGNLSPYTAIEISPEDFQEKFVREFEPSTTRSTIFENYLRYLEDFRQAVTTDFFQFINGSFVTKKHNPNDLDLVTFIDYRAYEESENRLSPFKGLSSYTGIDAYIEKTYPENHPYFVRFQTDLLYWNSLFTKKSPWATKGIYQNQIQPCIRIKS